MIKAAFYLVLITILFVGCDKDTTENKPVSSCNFKDYHFYEGTVLDLSELSNNYVSVGFDTMYSDIEMRKFISSINDFDQNYRYTIFDRERVALKFNKPKTCEEITDIISNLQKNPIVAYASYTMKTNTCMTFSISPFIGNVCVNTYSNEVFVKVFDENNLTDLYKMIAETKTQFVSQNQDPFMRNYFTLKVTKNSKGDGLQMANYFRESKLFAEVSPGVFKLPVE